MATSVKAYVVIAPALGVDGPPTVGDVQEPSSSSPCGNVNIADNLDISDVVAVADGGLAINVTNFE